MGSLKVDCTVFFRSSAWIAAFVAATVTISFSPPVLAQEVDSTAAPVSGDSTAVAEAIQRVQNTGFYRVDEGSPASFGSPFRRAELDLMALLGTVPGFFEVRSGPPGWPGGVSPFGQDPNGLDLRLDGLPFDDLITGRPRTDLLPYGMIDEIRLQSASGGNTFGIQAVSRSFDPSTPNTDIRYRSSNTGLQSVDVVHAQTRPFRLTGADDRLDAVFGYAGAAAAGEYPGSRLRRARRIYTRLRLDRGTYSLELTELYNRRRIGAHGGVLPIPGQLPSSIYQRIGASVIGADATRTTIRNDLALRIRTFGPETPLTVTGFWTTQTLQYGTASDTTTARIHRTGVVALREARYGRHRVRLSGSAWVDRFRSGTPKTFGVLMNEWTPSSRSYLEINASDSTGFGNTRFLGKAGYHNDDGHSFASAFLQTTSSFRSIHAILDLGFTGLRSTWLDNNGFGETTTTLDVLPGATLKNARLTVSSTLGAIGLSASVFASELSSGFAWSRNRDTNEARAELIGDVRRLGISVQIRFRSDAVSGVYGILQPSIIRMESSGDDDVDAFETSSLPEFWVSARLGIRALLFSGDMDLDLSVRGSYWDGMIGRRLDPITGLLMLPVEDDRSVPASGTLDVVAEAGIRTATLFLSFENLLSGTSMMAGNLMIPDYPLPAKRFRFGVYWPIKN